MKILRSVIRRGFNLGTAGYFNVLKPNTWFAASRFPDRFQNLHARAEAAVRQQEISNTPANQSTLHLDLKPQPEPIHLMRLALIILVAAGITVFLLWWIFVRPHAAFLE